MAGLHRCRSALDGPFPEQHRIPRSPFGHQGATRAARGIRCSFYAGWQQRETHVVVIAMGTLADDLMPVVMDAEPDADFLERPAGPPLDQVLRQAPERRTDTELAIA